MLKVGWKASAEQFGPRDLVDVCRAGRGGRARLGLHLRPLPALAPPRRARAVRAVLAGRRRRADRAGPARHLGHDADVPLQPGRRRAGVRHARRASTRAASCSASAPARRSTRSPSAPRARRGRSSRSGSPGCASRSTLMRKLWTEERVDFEGDYYRTHGRHGLRPAGAADPRLRRRRRTARRPVCRPVRRRVHLHLRARARSSTRTSCCPPSTRAWRSPAAPATTSTG